MVTVGKRVAPFTLPASNDSEISLDDYQGTHLVLYFYPKDNTPGCTREGQDFRDAYADFRAAGADVLGVSRDSPKVHRNFREKHGFPFELLSDRDEKLCRQFDVIRQKKLYGREYMGVERSTFVLDKQGVLRAEWRKVKVPGHVAAVLEAVRSLN